MRQPIDDLAAAIRSRPALIDAAVATGLLAFSIVGLMIGPGPAQPIRESDATAYLLVVAGVAPYYLRSRYPLAVFVAASIPVVALLVLGYSTVALGVGLFLLAFTVGAASGTAATAAAVVWAAGVLVVLAVTAPERLAATELATNALLFAGAFTLGRLVHQRRRYTGWVEERAALLERDRSLSVERAVAEERVRIARDLHDVVGHSLGVIAVQAGVARHVLDTQPEEARAALDAIAGTSRTSLTEIRRILHALRTSDEVSDYVPVPGTAALPTLLDSVRAAGVTVEPDIRGAPADPPAGVDVAVYRVVQESLTNVIRHAPGATARVRIHWAPDEVAVSVTDDGVVPGRDRAPAGPGLGLVGMRERVHAVGGSLHAGPLADGGFAVTARIPLGGGSA